MHRPDEQKIKSKVNPRTGIIEIKKLHPFIQFTISRTSKKIRHYEIHKLEGINCKQRREERYKIKRKENEAIKQTKISRETS
jgi:hypothetical protein